MPRLLPTAESTSRIKSETWANAISTLISAIKDGRPGDGFVAAVNLCGEQLARHLPPGARKSGYSSLTASRRPSAPDSWSWVLVLGVLDRTL
jgi:hypothetical protein